MPFRPGVSGNPGGRPKALRDIRESAREYTDETIARLVVWARSDNARASVAACSLLLSYGWGKPPQAMEVSGPNGAPITQIQQIIVDPADAVTRLAQLVEREAGAEVERFEHSGLR
jgi:hypothetical protein